MWLPTPSARALTRPRLAVVAVAAVAAVVAGYLVHGPGSGASYGASPSGGGLRRRNAVRHARRLPDGDSCDSETSGETTGDENVNVRHDSSSSNRSDRIDTGNSNVAAATSVEVDALITAAASDGWWNDPTAYQPAQRVGHNIVSLLFRVSEDHARRSSYVHRGCQCNVCGVVPIRGIRYRCTNCADFDLCETCEAQGVHTRTHIFYKIKIPIPPYSSRHMQPIWYTGDPDTCRRSLHRGLITKLSRETGFERPEVEAFWEQWTFMAASEWKEDPDEVGVAMDRKTFERCLVPTGGSHYAAPNLIHDRMFAFYDTNNDGLITFSEFLHGLAYRKRKDKLRKIFDGYDIDDDGYVSRRDFLRMFRAYYVIYKQMHKDIVDLMDGQLRASAEAVALVHSRQPLSSFFGRDDTVPPSNASMRFEGKTFHEDGSVHLDDAHHGATVENGGDTASREDILTRLFAHGTERQSDTEWLAARNPNRTNMFRAYWAALLNPPTTLDGLYAVLAGGHGQEMGARNEDADQEGDELPQSESDPTVNTWQTESELLARMLSSTRRKVPELEKQQRAMARGELHKRWTKRMFYLDEEEGSQPPDDWSYSQDYIARHYGAVEEAQAASRQTAASKVRFVDGVDDFETRSNPSTSSRSVAERWGGMDIPDAEREAGKEILYQVTQQAFNELLDIIFKPVEDIAYEAGVTKEIRESSKVAIDALDAEDRRENEGKAPGGAAETRSPETSVKDALWHELWSETGYMLTAVDSESSVNPADHTTPTQPELSLAGGDGPHQHRDPTMPQFRLNSIHDPRRSFAPSDGRGPQTSKRAPLSPALLRRWRMLAKAEAVAKERSGWGRLNFEEFELIYKNQEAMGNRLDFLGSWIDFCIP